MSELVPQNLILSVGKDRQTFRRMKDIGGWIRELYGGEVGGGILLDGCP